MQIMAIDGSHLLRCVAEALEHSPYCAVHARPPDAETHRTAALPAAEWEPDVFPWDDEEGEA
jgi:hypothetical protein